MTVIAKKVTATGEINAARGKVLGIHIETTGTLGNVLLKDVGDTVTLIDLDTIALISNYYVPIPGGGIDFGTDITATLTNVGSITVIYENN